MNEFVETVLAQLGPIEEESVAVVTRAIEDLERKGWHIGEVISKLRWIEEVDPDIPEDVALRNMRAVDEKVAARQQM